MSHDLLVQKAYRTYFLQCLHYGCLLLNKREQVTHFGTTNQKFATPVLDRRPFSSLPNSSPFFPSSQPIAPLPPPPTRPSLSTFTRQAK